MAMTLNVGEALEDALENLGVIGAGDGIEGHKVDSLIRTFNMSLSQFQSVILGLWTWRNANVFLTKGTADYLLGPTGGNASESYAQTTLSADAAATDTTVSLTSATGIADADKIGIVLNSGGIHWTTVSAIGGTTIAVGMPSAASAGNAVFAYTTKIQRPMELKDIRLRYVNGDERPCNVVPVSEYNLYTNKATESEVVNVAHEPLLDNTLIHVWPAPDNSTSVLKMQYKRPITTLAGVEDVIEAPQDVYKAIIAALTSDLAPKYGIDMAERLDWERKAKTLKDQIHDFEDDTSISFAPGGWN